MKYEEIKALNDQELADKLKEQSASLSKMQMNHAVSPIENPMTIRYTRKTIARLQTELNNRKHTASK
jgi:large subunit ribosomal protein L29